MVISVLASALLLATFVATAQSPIGNAPATSAGAGTTGSSLANRNQLSIDVVAGGISVAYAHNNGAGRTAGLGVGVGPDILNFMLVGGRHFAEAWAYEPRDGATGKALFELAHVGLFFRDQPSRGWQYDVGVRGSYFLHFDSSDDDAGGAKFLGVHGALYYGGRHVKVGPRLLVGRFQCGSNTPEFGINVSPLTVRFLVL
jgi:hypothetical protein